MLTEKDLIYMYESNRHHTIICNFIEDRYSVVGKDSYNNDEVMTALIYARDAMDFIEEEDARINGSHDLQARAKQQLDNIKNERPRYFGLPWTIAMNRMLEMLYDDGDKIEKIAERMERSMESVVIQINTLGLDKE